MISRIEFVLKCEPMETTTQSISVNKSIQILPFPNDLHIDDGETFLSSFCLMMIEGIEEENPVIEDFTCEMREDFGITFEIKNKLDEQVYNEINPRELLPIQQLEGYQLIITNHWLYIQAASVHGMFNGLQTLCQLILTGTERINENQNGWLIHLIEIYDWSAMKIRGIADDVARGQIPTVEGAKQFIKTISQFKNNWYGRYLEDAFCCSKHPHIGENRGAFTPEELQEIDNYAQRRFVTVFPIFETLGHMDNILTIPEYRELGEFPGSQCLSLANGNIYPLLRDFISELSPCFTSKVFHAGLDETFDLGRGTFSRIHTNDRDC